MSNLNVTLSGSIQVFDTTQPGDNQCIVNRPIAFSLAATVEFYEPYFQALSTGSALVLPAATIFAACITNKSTTANLTITYTPFGGSPISPPPILPGGFWAYFQVTESGGGGITAMTLTGAGATVPAEVLLAA